MTSQRRKSFRRTQPCTTATAGTPARHHTKHTINSIPSSAILLGSMLISSISPASASSSSSRLSPLPCFVSSPAVPPRSRDGALFGRRIPSSPPPHRSPFHQSLSTPASLAHHNNCVGRSHSSLSLYHRRSSTTFSWLSTRSTERRLVGTSLAMTSASGSNDEESENNSSNNNNNTSNEQDSDSWSMDNEEDLHDISSEFEMGHSTVDDDGENVDDDDDDDGEDDDDDDMKSSLDKIEWLPSVRSGKKQPYRPPSWPVVASRKENADKGRYETVQDNIGSTKSIEILPVLPMTMVHGLEGLMMNGDDVNHDLEGGYASGVWEEESTSIMSSLGPIFSGTSSYLPHTKGHVFTIAEPRYKKLYDDLLRMGSYYGRKRESAMRRAKEGGDNGMGVASGASSLPDPDEKRRFIVTVANPREEGVFAEYGLLFQLRDLDEVAAVSPFDTGDGLTLDDLHEMMEANDRGYGDDDEDDDSEDLMSALLQTHYEAKHDVVGRVKIHRIVNPEVWNDGPDGEEYLMAEATILDVVENDRAKMLEERKKKTLQQAASQENIEQEDEQLPGMSWGRKLDEKTNVKSVGDVANAVARIKEELRSAVGETFKQQQKSYDHDQIKGDLRSALNDALISSPKQDNSSKSNTKGLRDASNKSNNPKRTIPLVPKGILVDKRTDDSLTKEERALRESFAKLVSLQHELREECRFTRVSINTFGIGPVGSWLSAAAWSQFLEKRMEASHGDMQSDLQAKLAEYLADRNSGTGGLMGRKSEKNNIYAEEDGEDGETIDFEELSPELQQEFQLVQARAADELGPLALERAIQIQRIVQAVSYKERLTILKECVDAERRRLEAKKLLQLALNSKDIDDKHDLSRMSRKEARSIFERLMAKDTLYDSTKFEGQDGGSFQ